MVLFQIKKFFTKVNESRAHGRVRGLLSIPRRRFNVLDYACSIVKIVKYSL